jgi:hypothetical protein
MVKLLIRRKAHNVHSRVRLENPFFMCEDVVSLTESTTPAADAVFFGSVIVAHPADLMVKTVGGQARSCVSQLVVRFHPISYQSWLQWNRTPTIYHPAFAVLSVLCGTVRFDFVMKSELFAYMLSHIVFRFPIAPYCIVFLAVQCLPDPSVMHVAACRNVGFFAF